MHSATSQPSDAHGRLQHGYRTYMDRLRLANTPYLPLEGRTERVLPPAVMRDYRVVAETLIASFKASFPSVCLHKEVARSDKQLYGEVSSSCIIELMELTVRCFADGGMPSIALNTESLGWWQFGAELSCQHSFNH